MGSVGKCRLIAGNDELTQIIDLRTDFENCETSDINSFDNDDTLSF
jgi:hypothetical protein